MANERTGDIVLPQGTYVLLQTGDTGEVKVIAGPAKVSMADTDKPVIYERESRRYAPADAYKAIRVCPAADEGQYIILTNPASSAEPKAHPPRGKQDQLVNLSSGRRVNIQGPRTFALWPGQVADVVDGHQLKSNEYLIIRVYNEEEARANLSDAVVKAAETTEIGDEKNSESKTTSKSKVKSTSKNLFEEKDIRTGNLLIIKGTDVSFYIPPTGIEVLEDGNGNYTRNAVTLERLEYCILLDQNGDKRYVKGPAVVFPKPTESFIENNNKKVFKALELNENMGLYIKVISDYSEGTKNYKAGEELFITGKEQKIYFPRAEHAIIKYGDEIIHYATAVPAGEGRYILDKNTGDVKTIKGPVMLLPDPRTQVIVKRVLSPKQVSLWYPGNTEAIDHNVKLAKKVEDEVDFVTEMNLSNSSRSFSNKATVYASSVAGSIHDELERKTNYTKPRTIKLDTKYEGAVLLNIWPNFAVQVVNRVGERRVVEGPRVVMLDYDETLDVLELSTGKPKSDHELYKTVYLQTKNNVISDIVTVETKDLVNIDVRVSYKVNFEGDPKKWFSVSDYVKLLTQHMRSIIRNVVKKKTVEEFYENASDIIRDIILGNQDKEGKRHGRSFEENGMKIYDVEILNLEIDDSKIASMIINNQHQTIEQNLKLLQLEKEFKFNKREEEIDRDKTSEKQKSLKVFHEAKMVELAQKAEFDEKELGDEESKQTVLDEITKRRQARKNKEKEQEIKFEKEKSLIRINEIEKEMAAITPKLIEAFITVGNVQFSKILAENLTAQRNGNGNLLSLFGGIKGGWQGMLETVKGTPLESRMKKIMKDYENLNKEKENNN